MIDIKALERPAKDGETSYLQRYKESYANRKGNISDVDRLMALNERRKQLITEAEVMKAEQNRVSQEIAVLKREKKDAREKLESMQLLAKKIKDFYADAEKADRDVNDFAATFPNLCHSSVPVGKSGDDNKIVRTVGVPTTLSFAAKDHADIGTELGIIDFDRAAKISGTRFAVLKGLGARLERALTQFMLDVQTKEHGYTEMLPPFMVNSASLYGTGQFPKFYEDVFHLKETDYHLIPTAEVPVTNYYRDEILKESELPISYAAYSPCFRSEAGSYGKDTKGLIRQHQFNKVEIVKFCHPSSSYEEHECMTNHAEAILKKLELPYRVMSLCTGDIGFGAAKCHDLEVWLPAQNAYREISSVSNFEDFQARRAAIRFKPNDGGKPQFVHTLNGSGLAVGRTLVAVLENYQNADGSVSIPKVLQPYIDGLTKISKALPQ